MKNRRILHVYETRKDKGTIDKHFPGIEDGVMPEGASLFIRSRDGVVDAAKLQNIPDKTAIILMNVEIPIVENLIELCGICVGKECEIVLFTDTVSKYDDELPEYKKYLGSHWGDNIAGQTIYPIEWVE